MRTMDCTWYEEELCNCGCKLYTDEMLECKCSDNQDEEEPVNTIPDNSDGQNM